MKRRIALFVAVLFALVLPLSGAMATMMATGGPAKMASIHPGAHAHHGNGVAMPDDAMPDHAMPDHAKVSAACAAHCALPALPAIAGVMVAPATVLPDAALVVAPPALSPAAPPAPPPRALSA